MKINLKQTLDVYSISANLKAIPSEPNNTDTKAHASQKGFKRNSNETSFLFPFLIKSDNSSNASAIKERAVPSPASSNSSSSAKLILYSSIYITTYY